MDFIKILTREFDKGPNKGMIEIYPDFIVGRSKDLMVRGRSFYAIWDEEAGLWSTDEYDVQRLVDQALYSERDRLEKTSGGEYIVRTLQSFGSNGWTQFQKYLKNVSDSSHPLDNELTFKNNEIKKDRYSSRRLPYDLTPGDYSSWNEIVGTLYSVEERAKIEWAIGAIVSGDSNRLQKFIVLYGPAGTGKSTILEIIQKLFQGYTTVFEAKALGGNNNAFATEVFRHNPLVAIQHDGDLSKIEDNTKLNSIISHEEIVMNEKYKPSYTSRINAFLFMGTNHPVKISDAKSGMIRRLIDAHPTGVLIPENRYHILMGRIDFELGAIASHCLDVYHRMGKNYYSSYKPLEMMLQTDVFFNYVEAHFDIFRENDGATLKQAYHLYKEFCADTGIDRILPQYKFREELRNYFDTFEERGEFNGETVRSLYRGFNRSRFRVMAKDEPVYSLVLDETTSILEEEFAEQPAQNSKLDEFGNEIPFQAWRYVTSTLAEIDSSKVHFVKVPANHIVIDFDLKDENGNKSADRNLAAASSWPPTYGEYSKGGGGVHLHYFYDGDTTRLSRDYSDGIEIKTFSGNASLRRRLTKCNNIPIATISTGLPLKEKKMLTETSVKSEKGLRDMIIRNLHKEIHPGTKPSIDFIHKILEDAYASGMTYDVTDMRSNIIAFANNSTNQSLQSIKTVQRMQFKSEDAEIEALEFKPSTDDVEKLAFFDVEVFVNLFIVCWKYEGSDTITRMINPTPAEVEGLFNLKLVGFNNRRYDNHILYARFLGYTNEQLYKLSQKIISGNPSSLFGEAYNLSYTDIYDYLSKKQGLKKWQIELGIDHIENAIPWDEPVPDELIDQVVEYCCNDVTSTEAVHVARAQDFNARMMLSELSGISPNATTQTHTAKIIFGNDRHPQRKFVYSDLSKEFPGYVFEQGKSTYRGVLTGEGGYVYSEPGVYQDVAVLDVASMHPTSIEVLNLFGDYTKNFSSLKRARMAIKHKEYEVLDSVLDGKLKKFVGNPSDADALSYALKIVINSVYGLTSAKFVNPFRDVRNKDNIVAKRGALFMVDLKQHVQEKGFTVAHIKTDSIKIPGATDEIIEDVIEFGKSYGYDFEFEGRYEKMALINDAVYIAKNNGRWEATGAQFAHPYVYKTLFSGEEITFNDLCETRSVQQGSMYMDFDYERPWVSVEENNMVFLGRVGRFIPVNDGCGGGLLYRVKDGKRYSVTGTKSSFWLPVEMFGTEIDPDRIDMHYFQKLADDAVKAIEKFGSFDDFVGGKDE